MHHLLEQMYDYLPECQQRTWQRFTQHLFAQLLCLGRHTITGLLCACGRHRSDWSADYRLYAHNRIEPEAIFMILRQLLVDQLTPAAPIVTALDDTLLAKTGKHIPTAGYYYDPLSPPFHANLCWAQRVLQISMASTDGTQPHQARMIPIDFIDAPKAPPGTTSHHRRQGDPHNLSQVAADRLGFLRQQLDLGDEHRQRQLWVCVDNRFTNATVLQQLPPRTTLIGRIRGDTKLYFPPASKRPGRGRHRGYGPRAPTPQQLHRNPDHSWQPIEVFAFGKMRTLKYKRLRAVRWRVAGEHKNLQLIVIAPIRYRTRKHGPYHYRQPSYLICTDANAAIQDVIQYYLWRWDIEVNFRDEKQILGVGQAQVRHPQSTNSVPALAVAAYALLLQAASRLGLKPNVSLWPLPRWRQSRPPKRFTTNDLIQRLRGELWGSSLSPTNFSGFCSGLPPHHNLQKFHPQLADALFHCRN